LPQSGSALLVGPGIGRPLRRDSSADDPLIHTVDTERLLRTAIVVLGVASAIIYVLVYGQNGEHRLLKDRNGRTISLFDPRSSFAIGSIYFSRAGLTGLRNCTLIAGRVVFALFLLLILSDRVLYG
jgi:hypothetical protein